METSPTHQQKIAAEYALVAAAGRLGVLPEAVIIDSRALLGLASDVAAHPDAHRLPRLNRILELAMSSPATQSEI